jgi:hypothetical protein
MLSFVGEGSTRSKAEPCCIVYRGALLDGVKWNAAAEDVRTARIEAHLGLPASMSASCDGCDCTVMSLGWEACVLET